LDAGIVNLTESMRMEALAKALKDISERYNEASIAWERVGIKQSSRDVSFMANTPRNHEMPNLPSEAAVTQDVAIPTPPAADASKAELLAYTEKLKAALAQKQEEVISLRSDLVKLSTQQEGAIYGIMRNAREQVEKRHKPRATIKRPMVGDIGRGQAFQQLVAAEAKRQEREQKNAARAAKESRERPLLDCLLAHKKVPPSTQVKDLKMPLLKSLLSSLELDTRGQKPVLFQRLAQHFHLQLDDEEAESEEEATDTAADGDEMENQVDDEEVGEETLADERIEDEVTSQAMSEIEAQLRAKCEVDHQLIAQLLANREDWMKTYWDYHLPTASTAYAERQSRLATK